MRVSVTLRKHALSREMSGRLMVRQYSAGTPGLVYRIPVCESRREGRGWLQHHLGCQVCAPKSYGPPSELRHCYIRDESNPKIGRFIACGAHFRANSTNMSFKCFLNEYFQIGIRLHVDVLEGCFSAAKPMGHVGY